MYKSYVCLFLIYTGIMLIPACLDRPEKTETDAYKESQNPLTIPLSLRLKESGKKNLVQNPSFETGRYYEVDSSNTSFILPGWRKAGENVYWTDVQKENEFERTEAYDGLHSVKIIRNNPDETDNMGEGIISDFIRVIPGNYRLSYHIRLQHIESQFPRMHINLGDGINIRIFFYDKNKVIINSTVFNPETGNLIDNSFKGFSFSANSYIDHLGWGRALGNSAGFPFTEGDLPDQTHYVRLFFGLKGKGTMWVDMIGYEYTDHNFTFLEKTEIFSDSIGPGISTLIPSPRHFSDHSEMELRVKIKDRFLDPVILVPLKAGDGIMQLAEMIAGHLQRVLKNSNGKAPVIRIINKPEPGLAESGRLIFSLGKTVLYKDHAVNLPVRELSGKPQAYFIHSIPSLNRVVFIDASEEEGFYHAGNTLLQLIATGRPFYRHFDILDYPDILERAVILPVKQGARSGRLISHFRLLSLAGYNTVFLQDEDLVSYTDKKIPKPDGFLTLSSQIRALSVPADLGVSFLNLRFILPGQSENKEQFFIKQEDFYKRQMKEYVKEGISKILFTDETVWEYLDLGSKQISFDVSEPKAFETFLDLTGIYMQGFRDFTGNLPAGKEILFLPVLSTNNHLIRAGTHAYLYLNNIRGYSDMITGILWGGPTAFPDRIDLGDSYYYRSKIASDVHLFVNTLKLSEDRTAAGSYPNLNPVKVRIADFFNPFDIELGGSPEELGLSSSFIINQPYISDLSLIRSLCAADYLWNRRDYDPERAVYKVLLKMYGKERTQDLIRFNDLYCQLLQSCLILEGSRANPKNYRDGEAVLLEMNKQWDLLTSRFGKEPDLLNELSDIKNQVITRFYQVKRPVLPLRPRGES